MWDSFIVRLPGLGTGLAIFIFCTLLASPLAKLILSPTTYLTSSPLIRSVSHRAVSILVILFGCYLFLKLAGLTEFAVAIVSGTGVLGLILGFAFRDIAENFISSLLLTVQRPFRLGDVVHINEYTGVIQKVTPRATTLVDFDGNHIQIPNSTVYKGIIKNLTANPKMRGHFIIGVGYDSDVGVAQKLAFEILNNHPNVLQDPEPLVLIDNLGAATYNLKVYFWINVESTSVIKMASVLMKRIVVEFENSGISMPDDAREIIFPQGIRVHTDNAFTNKSESGTDLNSSPIVPDNQSTTSSNDKAIENIGSEHSPHDDVSSETDDIRRQAEESRDPEGGANIL